MKKGKHFPRVRAGWVNGGYAFQYDRPPAYLSTGATIAFMKNPFEPLEFTAVTIFDAIKQWTYLPEFGIVRWTWELDDEGCHGSLKLDQSIGIDQIWSHGVGTLDFHYDGEYPYGDTFVYEFDAPGIWGGFVEFGSYFNGNYGGTLRVPIALVYPTVHATYAQCLAAGLDPYNTAPLSWTA